MRRVPPCPSIFYKTSNFSLTAHSKKVTFLWNGDNSPLTFLKRVRLFVFSLPEGDNIQRAQENRLNMLCSGGPVNLQHPRHLALEDWGPRGLVQHEKDPNFMALDIAFSPKSFAKHQGVAPVGQSPKATPTNGNGATSAVSAPSSYFWGINPIFF